jgi:GDPmannose 4,6-dehydratase
MRRPLICGSLLFSAYQGDHKVNHSDVSSAAAVVIGASGQDGYFLTERLLDEQWKVHAIVRRPGALAGLLATDKGRALLKIHVVDLSAPQPLFDLMARELPQEIYNLSGQSSVSGSFKEPLLYWLVNANFVASLLECLRCQSPGSRLYQASSTDMFGMSRDGIEVYNENSALNPQSPYASAKAAAHLLCHSYREVYGLRIASGVLSNHESHRRPESFLSRKVVGHVLNLMSCSAGELSEQQPLMMGNLKIERDWGFAPRLRGRNMQNSATDRGSRQPDGRGPGRHRGELPGLCAGNRKDACCLGVGGLRVYNRWLRTGLGTRG